MEKLIVAVGSTRGPKVDAVRDALAALSTCFPIARAFEISALDVPSGVRPTPLSREETMTGARRRAEALRRIARDHSKPWQYFVGLEGGLDIVREGHARWVFLANWAYVADVSGHGAFGQSGALVLPEALVDRVVDRGAELAEAIDAFAEMRGVRDEQGAWGVLTRDLITRRDAIRISVVSAFAPLLAASERPS